jgi:Cu+-exporting ATPase
MDVLIMIGTLTAYIYSLFVLLFPGVLPVQEKDVYFEVSAVIIAFVLLGKYMEDIIKKRSAVAVRRLLDLAPEKATVIRDGVEVEVSAEDIEEGETIKVTAFGINLDYTGVHSIRGSGGLGDDTIFLSSDVMAPAELDGGPGSDILTGGAGNDILLGDAGNHYPFL